MKTPFGMTLEDSTTLLSNNAYVDTSTFVLSESRFNFTHLRFVTGYANDGYTIFEIPVTANKYFASAWPTGANSDVYRVFLFAEWTSDYSFTVRTGKNLWWVGGNGPALNSTEIRSNLTSAPDSYQCRPFYVIEGLCRKNKKIIPLDLNSWTVVNTNTITLKGGRLVQLGVGGWHENAYKAFTVAESGTYKVSYDYKIINARCGNHGTYGYGLWFTQNSPNVDDTAQYNFYNNSANRTGTVILAQGETGSNKTGHVSYNVSCNAGTTYYLWLPGAALDDGTTFNIDYINIKLTKV